ncbi:hypothetical protein GCM10017673_18940 [Streptosporangium violaceochromogenes]|nr:hypothetical protein GCM10017673_18940 [Streptosporangium violaceochromogenes]
MRIALRGEVDTCTADGLHRSVADVLRRQRSADVVVDLAGVTFLDARGIRMLLLCQTDAARMECRLTLANPRPIVRRILSVVGLLETFGLSARSMVPPQRSR